MRPYIVVLSGGDVETTRKRVDKGLNLLQRLNLGYDRIIFSGFNKPKKHDHNWKGKSWKGDERLKPYSNLPLDGTNMIHARNTLENALTTKEKLGNSSNSKMYVVTSETHIPRTKFVFRKVFGPNYTRYIKFISAKEPNDHIRRKRVIKEKVDLILHNYLLKDANGTELYYSRKKKLNWLYNLIRKFY